MRGVAGKRQLARRISIPEYLQDRWSGPGSKARQPDRNRSGEDRAGIGGEGREASPPRNDYSTDDHEASDAENGETYRHGVRHRAVSAFHAAHVVTPGVTVRDHNDHADEQDQTRHQDGIPVSGESGSDSNHLHV